MIVYPLQVEVRQTGRYDCGPSSLYSILKHLGIDPGYERLVGMFGAEGSTSSVYRIGLVAKGLGLLAAAYDWDRSVGFNHLNLLKHRLTLPLIFLMRVGDHRFHFVVIYWMGNGRIAVMDPGKGRLRSSERGAIMRSWTGKFIQIQKPVGVGTSSES